MTHLLQQAFAKISKLSKVEQNIFARWVLQELISDKRWEKAFAESEDVLGQLAEEALKEHKNGKTKPLHPDSL